jgi:hypothetical protein
VTLRYCTVALVPVRHSARGDGRGSQPAIAVLAHEVVVRIIDPFTIISKEQHFYFLIIRLLSLVYWGLEPENA